MSEQGKHTPGPWGWTYDGSSDYSIGLAEDPQGAPVANVYAWGRNDAKAVADCYLIAAAPDMLAALREAYEALRRDDVMAIALDPIYRARILKAIMKAEGRT